MNVVMVSPDPASGVPWEVMACLNRYSSVLKVRWVSLSDRYADGRLFPSDLLWPRDVDAVASVCEAADVFHLYDIVPPAFVTYMQKPALLQLRTIDPELPPLAPQVGQCYLTSHPLRQQGLPTLPLLMDPEVHCPSYFTRPPTSRLHVVFAPTSGVSFGARNSLAKVDVLDVLVQLRRSLVADVFNGIPYAENLARKLQADVIIDDVVEPLFHKTTLEGACLGRVVLSALGGCGSYETRLVSLADNLMALVKDRALVESLQHQSRAWVLNNWHPSNLVALYERAYEKCVAGAL